MSKIRNLSQLKRARDDISRYSAGQVNFLAREAKEIFQDAIKSNYTYLVADKFDAYFESDSERDYDLNQSKSAVEKEIVFIEEEIRLEEEEKRRRLQEFLKDKTPNQNLENA